MAFFAKLKKHITDRRSQVTEVKSHMWWGRSIVIQLALYLLDIKA